MMYGSLAAELVMVSSRVACCCCSCVEVECCATDGDAMRGVDACCVCGVGTCHDLSVVRASRHETQPADA